MMYPLSEKMRRRVRSSYNVLLYLTCYLIVLTALASIATVVEYGERSPEISKTSARASLVLLVSLVGTRKILEKDHETMVLRRTDEGIFQKKPDACKNCKFYHGRVYFDDCLEDPNAPQNLKWAIHGFPHKKGRIPLIELCTAFGHTETCTQKSNG